MRPVPPRIHILLARAAPTGLIIRRGPSRAVATLLWDRRKDTFRLGQWLKGRIYERRCDLSPDGKHFLYFAMNGRWKSEAQGSWSAISIAPYLKAIAMFPKGDCWNGGGLWLSDDRYWLNDDGSHTVLRDSNKFERASGWRPAHSFGGECPGIYYPRLMRDGWKLTDLSNKSVSALTVFERPCAHRWVLRKYAHASINHPPGKGCYWDEHELVQPNTGKVIDCRTWEWADLDQKRLVWATEGKLFATTLDTNGLVEPRVLHDFNAMQFEAIKAPY